MRFLMRVSMPNRDINRSMKEGTFARQMERLLGEVRPEAAYFVTDDGVRTAYLVVDMQSAHEMPKMAEGFFLAFDAKVDLMPAMVQEDLRKAGPEIDRIAKAF